MLVFVSTVVVEESVRAVSGLRGADVRKKGDVRMLSVRPAQGGVGARREQSKEVSDLDEEQGHEQEFRLMAEAGHQDSGRDNVNYR